MMNEQDADNLSGLMKLAVFLNRRLPRGKGAVPRYLGSLIHEPCQRFIRTRENAKLVVEPSSLDVFACIVNSQRTWNWHVLAACAAFLRPGAVFYDIGANIGFMSIEMSEIFRRREGPPLRVVAFEPLPALAEVIAASARLNGFDSLVVRAEVVSDHDGVAELFLGSHSIHASTRARELGSKRLERPTVTIDSLINAGLIPPPDVIKIDVEGGELAAFRGAARTIGAHHPAIVFESDENTQRFGYTRTDLLNSLTSIAPYRFFTITPAGDALVPLRKDSDAHTDPADLLATTADDTAIGDITEQMRMWAISRRIDSSRR